MDINSYTWVSPVPLSGSEPAITFTKQAEGSYSCQIRTEDDQLFTSDPVQVAAVSDHCIDTGTHCSIGKQRGACTGRNSAYYSKNCPVACGLCNDSISYPVVSADEIHNMNMDSPGIKKVGKSLRKKTHFK